MFSKIKHLSVKGGKFLESTNFELFSDKRNLRVIYGKNGSGKSTITKSILNINNSYDLDISGKFLDNSMNEISITEEMAKNIFVFNEEYIEKNIKLKEDGLGTIVMFGEQPELNNEIEEIEKKIIEINKEKILISQKRENLDDERAIIYNNILESLKGDLNWAGRDKEIKKNKANSSVNISVIENICSRNPKDSRKETISAFRNKKEKYLKMMNNEKLEAVFPIDLFDNIIDDEKFIQVLSKKINKPSLTERELKIFEFVSSGKQSFYKDVKNNISNPELNECPYCFQKITSEYKNSLLDDLIKVFSTEVEDYIIELNKFKLEFIDFNFFKYRDINSSLSQKCEAALKKINNSIKIYNNYIENKLDNIFETIEICSYDVEKNIKNLNEVIKEFNSDINEYNIQIKTLKKFKEEILSLNKDIAYYEISSEYKNYRLKNKKIEEQISAIDSLNKEFKSLDSRKNILISQKNNIKIAINYINNALNYIFFTKNKMSLAEGDCNSYKLYSNGLEVKPSNISCGERNALALSYFFTQILNNSSEHEFYKNQLLLVIDDPVSSFDVDNKIGIFSYLKSQFSNIIKGNENSRILIFTHDLPSVISFKKIFSEFKGNNYLETVFFEMYYDNTLVRFKRPSEYHSLLNRIYEFAKEPNKDDIVIGNSIRRVLEAFSTFIYKKNIEKVSSDLKIISELDIAYQEYFKNYMYKLFLNGESHLEETVCSHLDMTFTEITSADEKKRVARDIICFMYLLNKNHILAYLENVEAIESWCNDIKNSYNNLKQTTL